MKVVAIARGYAGIPKPQVQEPGDEFEMPDGATGSWFVPVAPCEVTPPQKRAKGKSDASDLA